MDREEPNYVEMAPLPVEEDDNDSVSLPPPPPPPEAPVAPPQQLRVEAKPFTPSFGNGNSSAVPPDAAAAHYEEDPQQYGYDEYQPHYFPYHQRRAQIPRQVSVTRAHYDEDGKVVYPARVTVVQNPGIMRMIAERDVRKGYRENSKKSTSCFQQQHQHVQQQQQQHVLVQTPIGAVMMPVLAPVPQAIPHQHHQPAFAVFNRQQQPTTSAAPHPNGIAPSTVAPSAPSLGDQSRSLASALMDPTLNPPPKYVAYNPFADTALDTMKTSIDTLLQDDDDEGVDPADVALKRGHKEDAADDAGAPIVDPLWLLNEVKRIESDATAAANHNHNNTTAISTSALLGLPTIAPKAPQLVEEVCTPEPIGPRPGGGMASAAAPPLPPPYVGITQNTTLPPPPPAYIPTAQPSQAHSPSVLPAPPQPVATSTSSSSTFVPNLSAKPFVPGSGMMSTTSLPTYTDAMSLSSAPIPAYRNSSSMNTTIHSSSSGSVGPRGQDGSGDLDDSRALGDDSPSMSNLKINPDAFFAPAGHATSNRPSSQAHGNQPVNPFSLQSLQGVRRAEHAMPLQQVVWQSVLFGGSPTWVPPVFPAIPDETVRLYNGSAHYGVTRPLTHPHVTLHLYDYQCATCPLNHIYPGKVHERPADVKLGGICGDVPALSIAHMIEVITGVKIVAIDMFGNNLGRCNLWLQNPAEVVQLTQKFDRKMWMSPVYHQYAVVALDDDGKEFLHWYLEGLRTFGPKSVRFPRHLVTCERWIV